MPSDRLALKKTHPRRKAACPVSLTVVALFDHDCSRSTVQFFATRCSGGHAQPAGGEDFSFYGQAGVPAAFVFLGIRNESAGSVHGVHTPQFTLDEEVLQTGAAYLASLAAQYLEHHDASTTHKEL